jgi:RNA polymerase sigma-70 factor, ECF subfamily
MRAHQNAVFSLAVRLLNNETEAQDIAQEVFLRAFQHFTELADSPGALAWLRTVARNLCINHLSRYRFRWRFFSELSSDGENESTPDHWAASTPPQNESEAKDERQVLQQALAQLPQAQRVALVLFHFEDMNYAEIAAQLGISLSKVKMDIFRGRIALRRRLKHDLDEGLTMSRNQVRLPNNRATVPMPALSSKKWAPRWALRMAWNPSL